MDANIDLKPKISRGKKNKFVVEENVDAIQWPQECAACGKPVEKYDENLDEIGSFMNNFKAIPPKVPYCQACYSKVKNTKKLDTAVLFLGFIFGSPLGILFAYSVYITAEKITKTEIMCMGIMGVLGLLAGIYIVRFIIRGPVKLIFNNRYVDYVAFDYVDVKISENNSVSNLKITIPNKQYAAKFAALNSVKPKA